jgi:type I site-specific restriction endonuclease
MGICYEQFSPGFFDLIVFDEAHRSIFNRFTEVIEYFDARMVGLTATPAAFIDRDTFRVFDCRDQTPTFLYTYEQAIKEGHLVDFTSWWRHGDVELRVLPPQATQSGLPQRRSEPGKPENVRPV